MIRECAVLLSNEQVAVIDFDGEHVQIPAIGKDLKRVAVKFENGRYIVCDNDECEEMPVECAEAKNDIAAKPEKKPRKKKPVKKVEE